MNSSETLVGKMLGPAYATVKIVADNIAAIQAIANNIAAVRGAAVNMHRNIATVTDTAGALGSTTYVELPSGLDEDQVLDYSVVLVDTDGSLHVPMGGHFTAVISDGALTVIIDNDAPAEMAGATIRWTLSYEA